MPSTSTWKCIEKETNNHINERVHKIVHFLRSLPNVRVCYSSSNLGIVPVGYVWFLTHRSLYYKTRTCKTPSSENMSNDRPYSVWDLFFLLQKSWIQSDRWGTAFSSVLHLFIPATVSLHFYLKRFKFGYNCEQSTIDEDEVENGNIIYANEQANHFMSLLTDQKINIKFLFNRWAKQWSTIFREWETEATKVALHSKCLFYCYQFHSIIERQNGEFIEWTMDGTYFNWFIFRFYTSVNPLFSIIVHSTIE